MNLIQIYGADGIRLKSFNSIQFIWTKMRQVKSSGT